MMLKRLKKKKINVKCSEKNRNSINSSTQKYFEGFLKRHQLQTLTDLEHFPFKKLRNNSHSLRNLLLNYNGEIEELLTNTYPNYPWKMNSINANECRGLSNIENQQILMERIYLKLNLKSLEDWKGISQGFFRINGGNILLYRYYEGNFRKLIEKIYPNYPWEFEYKNGVKKPEIYHEIELLHLSDRRTEKYQKTIDKLFYRLKLKTLDEFLTIPKSSITLLYSNYFNQNIIKLLTNLYPNFPWNFEIIQLENPKNNCKTIEKQREFMDQLFKKLKLKSIVDWVYISQKKFKRNGGRYLLKKYNLNTRKLLLNIYPNFPWKFTNERKITVERIDKTKNFETIENHRKMMEKMFFSLHLKTIDDWLHIGQFNFIKEGGRSILRFYNGNMKKLLLIIYPNYPWKNIKKEKINPFSIIYHRRAMDRLFKKLKLKSFEDWKLIPQSKIIYLSNYQNDIKIFLKSIYPNYPWDFSTLKIYSKRYFKKLENQREFMDYLFKKLKLKSIEDWMKISKQKIIQYGGNNLLIRRYNNDIKLLFSSIYPNYPFDFINLKSKPKKKCNLKSIENQRKFMDDLFIKFNLNSLDDWINLPKMKIYKSEGRILLTNEYKYNMKELLMNIYPNFPWFFPEFEERKFLIQKLNERMKKYHVTQKKDWYRVPSKDSLTQSAKYTLIVSLKIIFPNEKWKKSNFNIRKKKTSQRLLFSFTQKIYPSLLIFEDYFHPKLTHENNFELDIFIPALQLAMEYQGQQHYDDTPGAFGAVDLFQIRDQMKEYLANQLSIKIIYIPYWWDQSLESLEKSIQSSLQ